MKLHTPKIWLPTQGYGVRWKTELCDAKGRVIRELQRGRNMITDWGMDAIATTPLNNLIGYIHLGDSTETLKRVGTGEELTLTYSDASSIAVASDTNFFEAGDVGRTLKVDEYPELLITAYSDAQNITCQARASTWLPGFSVPSSPSGPYTDFGVHYTDKATLGNQTQRYNTYDTAAADYDAELNDSSNSRSIHQRIFLSATVTGSAWTVNQLGWGGTSSSTNCFGKTNLGSPDVIPVGNKYRVTLQVYSAYTPIDLTGVSLDWGATVGTHTCDIRQEVIGFDSNTSSNSSTPYNFLQPKLAQASTWFRSGYWTSAVSLASVLWEDDPGFSYNPHANPAAVGTNASISDSSYTSGDYMLTRTIRWEDSQTITSATALGFCGGGGATACAQMLFIKPQSGTITKPSGYWIELAFPIHWTRELLN